MSRELGFFLRSDCSLTLFFLHFTLAENLKEVAMRNFFIKHWTLTSIGILAIAAAWIVWSAVPVGMTTGGNIPAPMEGFLAPDLELTTLEGEMIRLSDLRGKVVLINFWASWCPPCRSEMPAMEQIHLEYGPDGFVILAVNNLRQDDLAKADQFVTEMGLTFPILLDADGRISASYQVHSLPTSFFVDQNGIIQEIVIGAMPEALLRTRAEELPKEAE
jgi:thiol-disulfide isomerase/thioredoxin